MFRERSEINRIEESFNINRNWIDCDITSTNLNDNTIEGIQHKSLPILSVQYHPEASPGPHDSSYLFKEFTELIDTNK